MDIHMRPSRVLALTLCCLMSIGAHYGKHALSALGPSISAEMGLNKRQFGLIFSFQELPGIVLPLYAGVLISFLRPHVAALLLTFLVFIGQVLVTISGFVKQYWLLLLGRLTFGLGDGALVVLQGFIIGTFFSDSVENKSTQLLDSSRSPLLGMSTAYGIMLLVSRLTTLSALGTPAIVEQYFGGLFTALIFSASICAVSLFAGFVFYSVFSEYYREARYDPPTPGGLITSFSGTALHLNSIWMFTSAAFFSFLHFSTDIFSTRYGLSTINAGLVGACTLGFAAVISPVLGGFLDHYGHRPDVLVVASALMTLALLRFSAIPNSSVVPSSVVLLGLGFAVAPVTLLSSVALVSPAGNLALMLGMFKCLENLGMAIAHYIAGWIADATNGYGWTLAFFTALCMLAVVSSVMLRWSDSRGSRRLTDGKRCLAREDLTFDD